MVSEEPLDPIQNGPFQGCSQMEWEAKKLPLLKICHRYATMIKVGTDLPYPRKNQEIH